MVHEVVFVMKLIVTELAKKFPAFYGTRKFYYRVQKSPPLVSVLSQVSAVHIVILNPY
jgi:hypothetical protein